MKDRIKRLEYWIVGGMGAVLVTLLTDISWNFHGTSASQSLLNQTQPSGMALITILTQIK
jgi:hypothetical protein